MHAQEEVRSWFPPGLLGVAAVKGSRSQERGLDPAQTRRGGKGASGGKQAARDATEWWWWW